MLTFSLTSLRFRCALGLLNFLLIACAPSVRLSTPEPVKIDVNMKVEIVQKPSSANTQNQSPVAMSRRNRMAQIQTLKDNRVIGENQNGYLTVLNVPPTWKDPWIIFSSKKAR